MHPDDVKFTTVMTPFGLYEWVVMPMGCRNTPATHQRRMNKVLRKHIGEHPDHIAGTVRCGLVLFNKEVTTIHH